MWSNGDQLGPIGCTENTEVLLRTADWKGPELVAVLVAHEQYLELSELPVSRVVPSQWSSQPPR